MVVSQQSAFVLFKVKAKNERALLLRQRYSEAPDLWTEEKTGGFVWSIPRKIMRSVVQYRRTAVPSAHEVGKSWLAARVAAWWIDSHPPGSAFVVTTAPTSKQVKVVLWKEIRRAFVAAKLGGKLNQTEWWLNEEMVAMGRKPSDYDPTAFQGIHAKYCLVILDEGCGIPENIYLAANSLLLMSLAVYLLLVTLMIQTPTLQRYVVQVAAGTLFTLVLSILLILLVKKYRKT
jgi:hypothetical protein